LEGPKFSKRLLVKGIDKTVITQHSKDTIGLLFFIGAILEERKISCFRGSEVMLKLSY
jgi:hypothetical protein